MHWYVNDSMYIDKILKTLKDQRDALKPHSTMTDVQMKKQRKFCNKAFKRN